jgi:putative transposase
MLNFKEMRSPIEVIMVLGLPAGSPLAGIEQLHMIRKGQLTIDGAEAMSICNQFSALAGIVRPI